MMPRCMRAWLAAICTATGFATAVPPAATPLFVLWQHPAETVPVDEPPLLAIYEDGTAIGVASDRTRTAPSSRGRPVWLMRVLPTPELGNWYEDIFSILKDEELRSAYQIDPSGTTTAATFHFQGAGRSVQVTVRGLWSGALSPFGQLLNRQADEVPARLLRVYQDALRMGATFDPAREWTPDRAEVRFETLRSGTAAAPRWPPDWPQPPSASAGATIALPAPNIAPLRELLPTRRGVVRVGDVPMQTEWRPVFPGESAWRGPLRATLDSLQNAATRARQSAHAAGAAEATQRLREQSSQAGSPPPPTLPPAPPAIAPPALPPARPEIPALPAPEPPSPTRR